MDRVRPLLDMREQVLSFPPQPVITEDNLTIQIDTVIYYQVTNPKDASYEIADFISAIEQLVLDHAAKRLRRHDARGHADLARHRQRRPAHSPGRGNRSLGHPREPGRAQVGGSTALDPGGDGEADARGARPARRDPHRRGRQAVPDPDRRG
ncbi:MAG: SPFH domain-containing protein [Thermoleophilaceae bacterium]